MFRPLYVSVCAWQFGHNTLRLLSRLSSRLPLTWSSSSGMGLPFHESRPQASQRQSFSPSLKRRCFSFHVGIRRPSTRIFSKGAAGTTGEVLPLLHPCPEKCEISSSSSSRRSLRATRTVPDLSPNLRRTSAMDRELPTAPMISSSEHDARRLRPRCVWRCAASSLSSTIRRRTDS